MFFTTIQHQINTTINISDSYTITQTTNLINPKLNISDYNIRNTSSINNISTSLNSKLDVPPSSKVSCQTLFCNYDSIWGDLQTQTIYGLAAIQIQTEINKKIHEYNSTIISPIYNRINTNRNISVSYTITQTENLINPKLNISDNNISNNSLINNISTSLNSKLYVFSIRSSYMPDTIL